MTRKSKRYNSSNWVDKIVPVALAFLAFLLVGTMLIIALTAFGVFKAG